MKPGLIITVEEVERGSWRRRRWRLVRVEQVYGLYGFAAVYGV